MPYEFLMAEHDIAAGEIICFLNTGPADETDPRRIQVDADTFILPPKSIYHSCSPNARIEWEKLTLVASEEIKTGEQVTYHYGTSEMDYRIGAFECTCGAAECVGRFEGFMYLKHRQREAVLPAASPYIRKLAGVCV